MLAVFYLIIDNNSMLKNRKIYLMRDLGIVALSVVIAIVLAKNGFLENILVATAGIKYLSSFIAGIFFTSVFTVAPATVILGELSQANSILVVAVLGGLGALIGDLIVFRFIKDSLTEDILSLINVPRRRKMAVIFKFKIFSWFIPFLGALIIASPLPDELGIAMMGLTKMRTSVFIPISFLFNTLGILVIGLIAKQLI